MIPKPRGLAEVKAVFGDPTPYLDNPAAWERKILVLRKLPFTLPFAGFPGQVITRIRAHALVVDHLVATLEECLDVGVPPTRLAFGGVYAWRLKRGVASPSLHTWGVAVDLDPLHNPLGKRWKGDGKMLHPEIIRVFLDHEWKWGNDWTRPDPMHFQYCVGY